MLYDSSYKWLTAERDEDGVLTIYFDRPETYNAVEGELHRELAMIFGDVRLDRETRAVIITGRGKAFSAGGDIEWFRRLTYEDVPEAEMDELFWEGRKLVMDLLEVEQPIIAAINGPAIGVGATIALLCDVIIAADNAKIGDPHVTLGVVAGDGGAVAWPWLCGAAKAKEYLMTGKILDAQEAERAGLVNYVVPLDELMPTARKFAHNFATGPQRAIRGSKAAVNKLLRDSANLILDTSLAVEKSCFGTPDQRAAMEKFFDENPKFREPRAQRS